MGFLDRFRKPKPEAKPAPAPKIELEPVEDFKVRFLWGRPRFTNEGSVGLFHLFGSGTPRLAVCGYTPKRDTIAINEAVEYGKALQLANNDTAAFCKRCMKQPEAQG